MNFKKPGYHLDALDLNVTPLVDVVLLLVLFFMVTAQFAVLPGLKLNLPEISQGAQANIPERLEISATSSGDLFFEGQPVAFNNLITQLDQTGADSDDVVILISADQEVTYGRIINIMDTLRQAGFKRVVFAARPEKSETAAASPNFGLPKENTK